MRPIDADALKEIYSGNGTFTEAHFRTAIDEMPTASPWHRVEEELPKVGTNCLVGWKLNDGFCYEDSVYGYGTNGLGFWVRREEHDQVVDPDYWMPIEPPKEEERSET
jgi:hypothetical protein